VSKAEFFIFFPLVPFPCLWRGQFLSRGSVSFGGYVEDLFPIFSRRRCPSEETLNFFLPLSLREIFTIRFSFRI